MNKTSAAFVFTSAMLLASLTSYAQDFGSVPDEKVPDISAVFTIDGESDDKAKKINGQTVTASKSDQSALLVKDGVSGSASKSTFNKSSGRVYVSQTKL